MSLQELLLFSHQLIHTYIRDEKNVLQEKVALRVSFRKKKKKLPNNNVTIFKSYTLVYGKEKFLTSHLSKY